MKYYSIIVQFASHDAPEFTQINDLIQDSVDYYNQKSRIATNPKQIIAQKIIDSHTIELILESKAELPYPGKALQTFSRYLVDPNINGTLKEYIYGKQLFKMTSKEIMKMETEYQNNILNSNSIEILRLKSISLILNATEKKLIEILDILKGE